MNECIFTGRTTKDIEVKQTKNGKSYARFSLANETGYGDNKKSHFFSCIAWEKTAESLKNYVPKGTKILVSCEANQNSYTDKNENKVETIDFRVLAWEFAQSKPNNQPTSNQPAGDGKPTEDFIHIPDDIGEELPFN